MVNELATGEVQPAPSVENRRRSHREEVETVGTIRTASDPSEAGRQVRVSDVSLHGVGIRASFPLKMDDLFTIDIGLGPLHLASRMRVVRVRILRGGMYDIGGQFC